MDKKKGVKEKCKHEVDLDKATFIPGFGYEGVCKKCGIKVFASRQHKVEPRKKPKMNKKARKAARKGDK